MIFNFRQYSYLPTILTGVSLIILIIFADVQYRKQYEQDLRLQVLEKINVVRANLENLIAINSNVVQGMVALLTANPDLSVDDYNKFARYLFEQNMQLRNIGAAPDLIIRYMYPLKGNESAVGLNYRENKAQLDAVLQARDEGRMILAGPIKLIQGGEGLIARIPVFQDDKGGQADNKFWGIISAVIDADRIYHESGLLDDNLDIEIVIRGKDGKGAQGDIFFGDKSIFSMNPELVNVYLPGGSWQMAAIPEGGWVMPLSAVWSYRLILISLFTFVMPLLYFMNYSHYRYKASTLLIESIIKTALEGIVTADHEGKIIEFSPGAERIFGYSKEEILGSHFTTILPEPYKSKFKQYMSDYLAESKPGVHGTQQEIVGLRKNGEVFPMELAASEEQRVAGNRYFTSFLRDITDRKSAEQELISARDEAEIANQAKSKFLANMSHELRTPLNAIVGFSQLYEYDKDLTDKQKANAREIHKAGEHLLSLINDVLDLSKIESGENSMSMESVSLSSLLDECLSIIDPLAESRGIIMGFESSQGRNRFVQADYTRLKQVILNLLSNAVKYNRMHGYIGIRCSVGDQDNTVRISIRDTAFGIDKDKQEELFQPFNRLGQEFSGIEGTGIGLVITKQLVEMMDGVIGVDSTPGEGSTFWIELKLAEPVESAAITKAAVSVAQNTIPPDVKLLIAEDNPANQAVLEQQLELLGLAADMAGSGVQAWEYWQQGGYDILLTDINMPQMDGYELVDKIRQAEQGTGEHMPIIAITANAMKEDARRCLEHGMDGFIGKPVNFIELQETLEQWLVRRPWAVAVSGLSSGASEEGVAMEGDRKEAVDITMLINLVGDDRVRHCKLFRTFMESTPEIIAEVQSAHKAHEAETVRQQAHKLKSSARSMGADALADACQALEAAGREGQWDEIDRLAPELEGLYSKVSDYINNYIQLTRKNYYV